MPRKAFVADLQEAVAKFQRFNVTDLKAGEEDGMITFEYSHDGVATEIVSQVLDLGEYPDSHIYIFYTKAEHVDPLVHGAVNAMAVAPGMRVLDLLNRFTKNLDQATSGTRHNPTTIDDDDDMMNAESEDGHSFDAEEHDLDEEEEQDHFDTDEDAWSPKPVKSQWQSAANLSLGGSNSGSALNSRIRQDLRAAKEAEFRVSHIGHLLNGGRGAYVMISIRIAKLAIPEEALDAWHLEPSQYFILLIHFTAGYKPLDRLGEREDRSVQFKVGVNKKHKLTLNDAIAAFATRNTESVSVSRTGLQRMFIGSSLEELLNDRLVPILGFRTAMSLPWDGATRFYADHQGRNLEDNCPDDSCWNEEEIGEGFGAEDHLKSKSKNKSFPLLAMQLTLRHFIRCTEFCLVCHRRVNADFEALKPYVCSRDICLYQYMSLGFGPSIEHEIITQPLVVDLLVSFCYSSACAGRMKYLPIGMALMVPLMPAVPEHSAMSQGPLSRVSNPAPALPQSGKGQPPSALGTKAQVLKPYRARLDKRKMELIFEPGKKAPLQLGSWISMELSGPGNGVSHCRVREIMYPTVRISAPVTPKAIESIPSQATTSTSISHKGLSAVPSGSTPKPITPAATPPPVASTDSSLPYQEVQFSIYEQNFDDLSDANKQRSICMLLDTLPSVSDMKDFLHKSGGQEISLRHWCDRISDAALGILRWIIASNRSCIVQVDSIDGGTKKSEERVSGMPNWMQFRFAQGAPDKEERFVRSIRQTTPGMKYPTLFAWHGSPLPNWHGIVREGLHFQRTDHGRAFGNGVYHSLQVSTSLSYSGGYVAFAQFGTPSSILAGSREWPQSQLKISQALALNEIVNAPSHFVSKSPHLVVAQLDWIQSRYLFVKCNTPGAVLPEFLPTKIYEQDPTYTPVGSNNTALVLPLNAVSKSRRPVSMSSAAPMENKNKKMKIESATPSPENTVYISDETDAEDLGILFSDVDEMEDAMPPVTAGARNKGKEPAVPSKKQVVDPTKTDFVPGALDTGSLILSDPPSYATSSATRTLQRELAATLKIQDTHPAHELGWYIDPNLITNVYQWIVELHSFEPHLVLARHMKEKGLKSIVMEIRFGKEYPISPPFVRVIRPRFLSFMQGGGGHVTAGGALCMELLTNSGWSAVSNIESVLLQVRLAMSSTDPHPAKLEPGPVRDYAVGEAVEAFVRACHAHGWQVPTDFQASYAPPSNLNMGREPGNHIGRARQ